VDEGAGEGELLLHPARQTLGQPIAKRRETHQLEQAVASRPPVVDAVQLGEEADVLVHREIAVEREALGEVADAARELAPVGGWLEPAGAQRAAVRGKQAQDAAQRRGLACAIGPDEPEHLAALDAEVEAVDGRDAAVAAHETRDLDERRVRHRPGSTARRRASAGMPGLNSPSSLSRATFSL
jgi:hypothetical protein